ncbi:TetR/AcrR family transcriptional regulator [Fodinicola acaciae]|uniref:TetR/AcrR family transcriptional regulator n=1 Tax=Fodinicola acaciae TaxID=2681555 RepID=UPI00165210BA|nr:TetR/AcrR family transcriptional regulator [Fodinicola acaciae]
MVETTADRGREVRRRLLNAATELIGERGWMAVSTRVLAERAQVTPGVVHYHFPSVSALLREAAIGALRELLTGFAPALADARTAEEGLRLMLSALDAYSGTDPASLLVTETYLAATRDAELRAAMTEVITEFRRGVADWLAGCAQPDPEETASVLVAALDGIMLHRLLNPDLTTAAATTVLTRVLRGAQSCE